MKLPAAWRAAMGMAGMVLAGTPGARGEDGHPAFQPGLVLDARAGHVDAAAGWLDGGLGKTRYGSGREANVARLAQASLLLKADLGETVGVRLQLNLDTEPGADRRGSRVGPIEAYLAYHPAWSPSFNPRARAGIFFPPVSLEHPGRGWTTVYTITPSALNSWVGEDLRATGAEVTLLATAGAHEVDAVGGAFGWNDPAGTLLAWRGWAVHDRQTGLRDRLPLPPLPTIGPGTLFSLQSPYTAPGREVDGRPGFYLGASWTWSGRLHLRGLCYDTRADRAAVRDGQYGWSMRFASAGARLDLPGSTQLVAQHLRGRGEMGRLPDGRSPVDFEPQATFLLLTGSWGRHRLTVRRDWFEVQDLGPMIAEDDNREEGTGWTAAYLLRTGDRHRLALEAMRLDSSRANRAVLGLPPRARELLVQLSIRLTL